MLLLLGAVGAGVSLGVESSRAESAGSIVFASDRDKDQPGEIYSLAPGRAPRDISKSLAAESGLAVAPVGDLIAFWSNRSGVDEVYLARSDGFHLQMVRMADSGVPLRDASASADTPLVFSRDGSRLFASYLTSDPVSTVTTAHDFVIDTRRSTAREIRACDGRFQPSPDGTLIACSVGRQTTVFDLTGRARFALPGSSAVWSNRGLLAASVASGAGPPTISSTIIVDESGAKVARVRGHALAWSPDGRLLLVTQSYVLLVGDPRAFASAVQLRLAWGQGRVSFTPDGRYVSAVDARGRPKLVSVTSGVAASGLDGGNGIWSADGRLAYEGRSPERPGATFPVFVTDTHGRHPQVVGRFPFTNNSDELAWLPDGRRLLLLTATNCGGAGLYAVPVDGGTTRPLTHDPRDLEAPTWSPDGTRIAYSAEQFACLASEGESTHLETALADGSAPQPVTDDGGVPLPSLDSNPSFSPDGKQIAFWHGDPENSELQIVSATGGARTHLPEAGMYGATPAWAADSSKIAYVAGDAIMAIAPTGGTPEVLAPNPATTACQSQGGVAWSPDGTQLAIGGDAGIYLVTPGIPASERLAISAHCAEYPSFSPDGAQIAFDAPLPDQPPQTAIMVANTDGSNLRVLSTTPFRSSIHPTWQPSP